MLSLYLILAAPISDLPIVPSKVMATTFTCFLNLPGELRNQIWRETLSIDIEPALFLFKPGLWGPRLLEESEECYTPNKDEWNWTFHWNYRLLDEPHLDIPLVFVNREARSIALEWILEAGIKFLENNHRIHFTRSWAMFDDILYIPADQTQQFVLDAVDRFSQPDIEGRNFQGSLSPFHLAVPEAVLSTDTFVPGLLQWYNSTRVLNIVLEPQPDFHSSADPYLIPRWNLRNVGRGAFAYNADTEQFLLMDGQDEYIPEDSLSKGVERLFKPLKNEMRDWYRGKGPFEIRTVYAVRG